MNDTQLFNVFQYYLTHSKLKETEQDLWINWNVIGRRESLAEHIYGSQVLALALYSEFHELENINIEHVLALLSFHESGKCIISNSSRNDSISAEEKAKKEKAAVDDICKNLKRKNYLISLFDEFEARQTPEAQFAFLCDKLDCDLQARLYSNERRCSIPNATYKIISNKEIVKIIAAGAKTVWEVFWEDDKAYYKGTFLEEFFSALKNY